MKKLMCIVSVLLISCGMIFAGTSVQEQVGTAQEAATGNVVTIGLSNYDGVQFSLSGGFYAAAQPGAKAVAVGSGGGDKFGPGARLQYTLYGNSGYFKIAAQTDEDGNGKVLVGISEIDEEVESSDGRTSGSIGKAAYWTSGLDDDYNGEFGSARDYGLSTNPAMYRLKNTESDVLLYEIESSDTWTGTTSSDGPQLYYELTDTISCVVTYTIAAED